MWGLRFQKPAGLSRDDLGDMVLRAGKAVSDFLYPPICPGCGILNGSHRSLCPFCWSSIRFIEKPYCAVLGMPFSFDPGADAVSPKAIAEPPDFDRLRSVALHENVARVLVHALKYSDRTDLAPMIAGWMCRAGAEELALADLVLPVPLHRFRLFFRRYNQSAELARAVAQQSGRPYLAHGLIRARRTDRQVGLGRRARLENVRGAFKVTEEGKMALAGKRVVLVDDVYTTGATVNAVARTLRRAGARDITVLSFAMAISDLI